MDKIRVRVMLVLDVLPKPGWVFDYDENGELVLVSASGTHDARRDTVLRDMVKRVEASTLTDDTVAWNIAVLGDSDESGS